jgi:heat shock protein HslJ
MHRPTALLVASLVCLLFTSMAAARGETPTTIEGVSWRLMEISKLDAATLDQAPRAIARFNQGVLAGFSSCNRFKGSYTIAGDRITIGNQTHTVNKCADPARDVETLLKMAFDMPVRYAIVDGRLECNSEAGITMVFEAEPAHALEGVEWEVVELAGSDGSMVAPVKGATLSFSFRADGAVVGNAGCNLFRAPYTRDGERLTIAQAAATRKACTAMSVMDQERRFLDALAATRTWTLRGEALDLLAADGKRVVTAVRPAF